MNLGSAGAIACGADMFHTALSALTFSAGEFLTLTEGRGMSGAWSWVFAGGDLVWSPGFYRLLGLVPNAAKARYDLLLSLIHPEDRALMPTLADIRQGQVPREVIVRVIRPNGTARILSLAMEVRFSAEGRPVALNGTALDVSDREHLARLRHEERRRQGALYRTEHITTFSMGLDLIREIPFTVAEVHGLPLDEICADPYLMVVPEERKALRGGGPGADRAAGVLPEHGPRAPRQRRALAFPGPYDADLGPGRDLSRPLRTQISRPQPFAGCRRPARGAGAVGGRPPSARRTGAPRLVDDGLAQASGLSHSTVRRLEEDSEHRGSRSRLHAVEALHRAGVRFVAMDDGTLAVARA